MTFNRKDCYAVLTFLGLLVLFFHGLFLVKAAPLIGDSLEQYYPWSFQLAQSLKHFNLPFWTPLIQCGFPLAAESQAGVFYLPNLLLFGLLPVQAAYAYINLLHWFIAGWGTYAYARQMKLGSMASFVAAVIFVFGAAYGGAYYNMTSLKTICWFPVALYFLERYLEKPRKLCLLGMALVIGQSLVAGYLQMAVLTWFVFGVYVFFRILIFPEHPSSPAKKALTLGALTVTSVFALLLAFPQIALTFQLAIISNRTGLEEGYAYVGSLSPFSLLTVIFPKLQGLFRGNCLYSGIFAILFVTASFSAASKILRKNLWLWTTLGVVSLLLALGQWSPLYVGLVKLTHFYSFRVPAKFLGFFCFSVAMLAGTGVQALREDLRGDPKQRNVFTDRYFLAVLCFFFAWGLAYVGLCLGRSGIMTSGRWIVENFIYGKPGHPRSLEAYLNAMNAAIESARGMLSLTDPWQLWAMALLILSCVWAMFFRKKGGASILLPVAIAILMTDLYVFAGLDIKKDFDAYQNVLKPNTIVQALLAEKNAGTLGRIYGFRKESETLPLVPSMNMLYGIEDIGGYSPLIFKKYYETIGRLGNVNDSNGMQAPEASYVLDRLPLLNALDVSHILSKTALPSSGLRLMVYDLPSDTYLYRNTGSHRRAYFVSEGVQFLDWSRLKEVLMSPGFDPQKVLLLEGSEQEKLKGGFRLDASSNALKSTRVYHTDHSERWAVETTGPGFFVLSNTMYPGWEAKLDDRMVSILKAYGLFQAVYIPVAGEHFIDFSYSPLRGLRRIFVPGEDKTHAE
ncbi:MAG: hypothetical protein ABH891_01165 [Candidatus Omnitrophota bacterium]